MSSTMSPYAAISLSFPSVLVKINHAMALSSNPAVSSQGSPASSGYPSIWFSRFETSNRALSMLVLVSNSIVTSDLPS